ncbi:hypothetical protein [Jannaschia seohaensis]|uniref:Uncharacterized protein n=1 Tax=Jannaschia seohaensis TaxID=475081 RepID=A0A2Y9AVV6_9RHOB|nr:hypothetical protein [Jannaschia seohaensis]PWJ17405.1 hypothetical protein BCF38_10615 [Jannaschia seohaensis]SSA47468.1 hypothetical protein SAMN05421539_10615 [Jannaschia seohaensis]
MLKPKPATAATPSEDSARDAARALLSMLETGAGAPASGTVPEAQMRRLARDLISQVERRPPPGPAETPTSAPARRTLFSRIAPLAASMKASDARADPAPAPDPRPDREPTAVSAPEPPRVEAPPPERRAPLAPASERRVAAPPVERAGWAYPATTAPSPQGLPSRLVVSTRSRRQAVAPVTLPLEQVRKLALQGIAMGEAEHPAIIALTLQGQAPLEQAAALRALPRGQARAVHRALRMLGPAGA